MGEEDHGAAASRKRKVVVCAVTVKCQDAAVDGKLTNSLKDQFPARAICEARDPGRPNIVGVAVFIYALLKHLADESPVIRITLGINR